MLVDIQRDWIRLPTEPAMCEKLSEPKYQPFQRVRHAGDGTHIPAIVSSELRPRFRNRKGMCTSTLNFETVHVLKLHVGFISQNVFACADFNMMFTFVVSGWEGSASDGTVYMDAIQRHGYVCPPGTLDLLDAGYALRMSSLTPFRGVRYHLKEFAQVNERYMRFPIICTL